MRRIIVGIGLLSALCGALHASPGEALTGGTPEQQQMLQRGLSQLSALEPQMSDADKSKVSAMKDILRRVCYDRQHATESEVDLARVLIRPDSRDVAPEDRQKDLHDWLNRMPGVATTPTVVSGTHRVPGGDRVGYVQLVLNGRRKTVVEIPAGRAGEDVDARTAAAAARVRTVQSADPLWWTRLRVGLVGGQDAVLEPNAPGGALISADAPFAREWGLSTVGLARQLVFDLRAAFDPSGSGGAGGQEQRRQAALDARQDGDDAFARRDPTAAEERYLAAVHADPQYPVPYQRLAALYRARGQVTRARGLLHRGMSLPGLDPAERREFQRLLRNRP